MNSYKESIDEIIGVRLTSKESLEIKIPLIKILLRKKWLENNDLFDQDDFKEDVLSDEFIQQASALRKYPDEKQRKKVFEEAIEHILKDINGLVTKIRKENRILKLEEEDEKARLNQPKNNFRDIPF